MLRGKTVDVSGKPLAGVKVTVKGHPEYGHTYSRGDGAFDMAVNGGAQFTLSYELATHLPVERSIRPGWQRYAVLPDVGLIVVSKKAATVNSGAGTTQVILGDAVTAAAPTNSATSAVAGGALPPSATSSTPAGINSVTVVAHQPLVIVEPNTTANALLPNGTAQPLTTLTVTATEYPITEEKAFSPGTAVAADGLSFGLEFTVGEAVALGAEHVTFSKPVSLYVEDWASLAPGKVLTVQHYDRATSQWEPGAAGSVIQLLAVANGDASIDSNGDGVADDPAILDKAGISASDRAELAKRYAAK